MASGGKRPGAPQNNPANVSATGGAGQMGSQAARYIPGGKYGDGKALMEQQQGASMAKAASPVSPRNISDIVMPSVGTLMDPTNNPSEPITAGVDFGAGPGSEALPNMFKSDVRQDEIVQIALSYLPDLSLAAQSPNAPDSYKRFVNYLIQNANGMPNG